MKRVMMMLLILTAAAGSAHAMGWRDSDSIDKNICNSNAFLECEKNMTPQQMKKLKPVAKKNSPEFVACYEPAFSKCLAERWDMRSRMDSVRP